MKDLESLRVDYESAAVRLDLASKIDRLEDLEKQMADPNLWNDNEKAQKIARESADLNNFLQPWLEMKNQLDDLAELAKDESLADEVAKDVANLERDFLELKKSLRFDGKYDSGGAIVRISSGAGGADAMDWAEMLERMYLRWAEKSGFKTTVLERSVGEQAGIKTSVIEIEGQFVYGKLRSENGVHRLVRLSPFNAESRETSFALVEVLPIIDEPEAVKIDDKDLKIDVYRAGGHGGQSVNTTDSAVRVTHLPTGIVVAIQNERSQLQNKEKAMEVLRGKLASLAQEQHVDNLAELRSGESANFGSQIRNYVLHPYKLVKDTRTKHETSDVQAVLDGEIDGFIDSYLDSQSEYNVNSNEAQPRDSRSEAAGEEK